MNRWGRIGVSGLAVAAAGVLLLPLSSPQEESLGLATLFNLRGPRAVPPDVCMVRMDRASARALGLPTDPSKWPRSIHARLLSRLAACSPAVIVFDVFFADPRDESEDAALEQALAASSNVVLCAFSDLERMDIGRGRGAIAEQVTPPLDRFARRAAAVAPFPLPKFPARVSRFWTFRDEVGNLPSLPVAAFLCFVRMRYPASWQCCLASLLPPPPTPTSGAGGIESAPVTAMPPGSASAAMRRTLMADRPAALRARSALLAAAEPAHRPLIRGLFDLHAEGDNRPINFYGPPSTIPALSYRDALEEGTSSPAATFAGKAVFIGLVDPNVPVNKDGFTSPFFSRDGQSMSGTEIAATAFANLLDGTALRPLPVGAVVLIVLLWGGLVGGACRALPALPAAAAALLSCGVYVTVAVLCFARSSLWIPVVVPGFVQPAVAFVVALVDRNAVAVRERRQIHATASLYLPRDVVARLAEQARVMGGDQKEMQGTCMITDAADYTPLSESLTPKELGLIMNRYFETAFRPVREQGGTVMNLTGDSILAVWLATPPAMEPSPRACVAALDVVAGLRRFNREAGHARLPTRIGIHHGPLLLGSMGALDHFEYVPIGDTVNTAARLEGLNKSLQTEVLVSAEAMGSVRGFFTRRMGVFRFAGKRKALEVFELLGRDEEADSDAHRLRDVFEDGVDRFAAGAWGPAAERFGSVLEGKGDDGPAAFYLELCASHARHPPSLWEGVIHVGKK